MTDILIADPHRLVREGLQRLIDSEPDLCVCAQSADTDGLVAGVQRHAPDAVLLDLHLPPAGGLDALRRALRRRPGLAVVCMGASPRGPYPGRLLEQGALGVLSKGCTAAELLGALRDAARGRRHISAELAQHLLTTSLAPGGEPPVARLTPRELAIMVMVSEGSRLKEISDRLCISPKTVSTYRSRLCRKLGVRSDVELTHLCLQHGLIESSYCH